MTQNKNTFVQLVEDAVKKSDRMLLEAAAKAHGGSPEEYMVSRFMG